MFTHKDIECRTIFVINCLENKNLRIRSGELLLEEDDENGNKKTLTKMPFQKILMLFVIGRISITTPLIDKCKKFNVAIIVVNLNLRPVFYWADSAEGNFLLRKKQYSLNTDDLSIAKVLVKNKIENQIKLLKKCRTKDNTTTDSILLLNQLHKNIDLQDDYYKLMGIEGLASKNFFAAYYQKNNWVARRPRVKCDAINSTLDIGYTILFNYIECFVRMFGFDVYVGVYHRLWFKRKSLICDLMEPFRCIIDNTIRTAFNRKQFSEKDFINDKGEWRLKHEKNRDYTKTFYDALMPYKTEVFKYVQSYYRCFMQSKPQECYPNFKIK